MNREQEILSRLDEKKHYIEQMYLLTDALKLQENEDEAEKYIHLMDKRAEVFNRVLEIDESLDTDEVKEFLENGSEDFLNSVRLMDDSIKATAYKILELDKLNEQTVRYILDSLKGNMKTMSTGKNMHSIYHSNINALESSYFDKKK